MSKCTCGASDCWDEGDYSWLASNSGWHGRLHGTEASVFFVHGKKIREQRRIPQAYGMPVEEFARNLLAWSAGLPEAKVMWMRDTGDGEADLWIEGVREPNADDWQRLREVKEREDANNRRELERLKRMYEPPPSADSV